MNKKTAGWLILVLVMTVWGSSFTITKIIVAKVPPFAFAFIRFLIALLSLLILKLFIKKAPSNDNAPMPPVPIFFMGLLGVTVFYIFFNLSLQYTSASSGALIQGFMPACIAILAVIFLKEKLSMLQITGIVLSIAGVTMIGLLAGEGPGKASAIKGNLFMIIAVLSWAIYTILSKKVASFDPLRVTIRVSFIGVLFLLPFAVAENWNTGFPEISIKGWLAIIYLGAIASAACYFLYNRSLETMSAAEVGNFLNLDPIIGLIIALIFLKEHINILQTAGGLLVIAGVFLSSWRRS